MVERSRDWLPKGLHVQGKRALLDALTAWLQSSDAPTIGDTSGFHGAYWITIDINGVKVKLAADTTRQAVEQVVATLSRQPHKQWRVVANKNGRINKVVIGDSIEAGWYAYVMDAFKYESAI